MGVVAESTLAAGTFAATATAVASSALLGAVVGAGINASVYSVTHRDVSDGKFWGGYFASAAIGAAVGFVTGGAFAITGAVVETASFGIRAGVYALVGAAVTSSTDALNQFVNNAIDKNIEGEDVNLGDGVLRSFITGAIFGAVAGGLQASAEAFFLKTRFNMNGDELANEPTELTTIKTNTPTDPLLPKPYSTIKYVENTLKSRAIMVGMNAASTITDASLEAAGY